MGMGTGQTIRAGEVILTKPNLDLLNINQLKIAPVGYYGLMHRMQVCSRKLKQTE